MAYKQPGPIIVGEGGTGLTTITDNSVLVGNGSGAITPSATVSISDSGEMLKTAQPCFLAFLPSNDLSVSGAGAIYVFGDTDVNTAFVEVFDQSGDLVPGAAGGAFFTAPISGRYYMEMAAAFSTAFAVQNIRMCFTTSNILYIFINFFGDILDANSTATADVSVVADMDMGDTIGWDALVSGKPANTADALGNANLRTRVSGCLLA